MKLEYKAYYNKHEIKICVAAKLIHNTMKKENVPVAWISREDTLDALSLREHQGSLAIVSLNKAFKALDINLDITAYDHYHLLVITGPMLIDVWGEDEDEEDVEEYTDIDDEEDGEPKAEGNRDEDNTDGELSVYVCEFCGIYNAYKPRCNKCESEEDRVGECGT